MDYKLIRSKRKTLCISIVGGEMTVKAPLRTSAEHIENFIASKQKWIEKKLAEQRDKTDALKDVIDGAAVMYRGVLCEARVCSDRKRTAFIDGVLCLPEKCVDKTARDKAVAAWGKRMASVELKAALDDASVRTGLKYGAFALTNARTKWGSCDGNGNIMLNWRLAMLDAKLVEYVIVHELSHTKHHNHGAEFWAEVQKHLPEYKSLKRRLKAFAVLTTMYR